MMYTTAMVKLAHGARVRRTGWVDKSRYLVGLAKLSAQSLSGTRLQLSYPAVAEVNSQECIIYNPQKVDVVSVDWALVPEGSRTAAEAAGPFCFEDALAALKRGEAVKRNSWKDFVLGVYIPKVLCPASPFPGILMLYQNHDLYPFIPDAEDLLAEDWFICTDSFK